MAQTGLKFTGDEADLEKAYQKAFAMQEKMIRKLEKSNQKARAAAKSQSRSFTSANEKSFGGTALTQLRNYVTGFASVTAAVGALKKMFALLREERERGKAALRAAEFPLGRLAQLARGDPARFQRMVAEARKSRVKAPTMEAATELQFALESAGIPGQRELMAGFFGITDPAELSRAAVKTQRQFGPGAGDLTEVTAKLFAASEVSVTNLEEFGPSVAVAAKSLTKIGANIDEVLTAIAVLSNTSKSVDTTATELGRLGSFFAKKGLAGKGLIGAFEALQAEVEGMTAKEFIAAIPEERARRGFQALQLDIAALRKQLPAVARLTGPAAAAYVTGIQALPGTVPEIAAAKRQREAGARLIEAEALSPQAHAGLVADAISDEIKAEWLERGYSPATRVSAGIGIWLRRAFTRKTAEPEMLREAYATTLGANSDAVREGAREGTRGPSLQRNLRDTDDPL